MADPQFSTDAFDRIIGVSTSDKSSSVLAARAVNMDFRNKVKPRSGLYHMQVVYDNAARDREIFETGNVQCVHKYQSNSFRPSGIMVLVAGNLFFCSISGRFLYVKRLFSGLNSTVLHGWMCQAFNWLICQNGVEPGVYWDGFSDTALRLNPDAGQMPIGGPMEFIHHRTVVASTDGQDKIAVSDLWRSDKTDAVIDFTESAVWANAGVFGLHASYGRLVGFDVIPRDKRTATGQGELLILASNGGQTINLQIPRSEWINNPIQDTANIGFGAAAVHGYITFNSRLWYASADGFRMWSPTSIDATTGQRDVLISGDVQRYIEQSDANNRNCICAGVYDSKVLFGINPTIEDTTNWGRRKFCVAWLSLDTALRSQNGQALPLSWDGLQTGIQPIQFVSNLRVRDVHRSYVMSYDGDGKNRIYEITNFMRDDIVDGKPRKVRWTVDYPAFGTDTRGGRHLLPKTPQKLRLDYTNADGDVEIEAQFRPNDSFCMEDWGTIKACGAELDTCLTRRMHRGRQIFKTPEPSGCDMSSSIHRVRLNGIGSVEVSQLIGQFQDIPNAGIFMRADEACGSCGDDPSKGTLCCEENMLYQAAEQPVTC